MTHICYIDRFYVSYELQNRLIGNALNNKHYSRINQLMTIIVNIRRDNVQDNVHSRI